MAYELTVKSNIVIPVKAVIQSFKDFLNPSLCGDDCFFEFYKYLFKQQ
jgi:hypothetical protein